MPGRGKRPRGVREKPRRLVLRNVDQRVAEAHQEFGGERDKTRQVRERSRFDPGFRVRGEAPPGDGDQRRIGIEPEAGKTRDGERLGLRSVPHPQSTTGARPRHPSGSRTGHAAPATPGTVVVDQADIRIERQPPSLCAL